MAIKTRVGELDAAWGERDVEAASVLGIEQALDALAERQMGDPVHFAGSTTMMTIGVSTAAQRRGSGENLLTAAPWSLDSGAGRARAGAPSRRFG